MTIDANIVIAYLAGEQFVIETIVAWRKEGTPLSSPIHPSSQETFVISNIFPDFKW